MWPNSTRPGHWMRLKYVDAGKRHTFQSITLWNAFASGNWVTSLLDATKSYREKQEGWLLNNDLRPTCRCSVILRKRGSSTKSTSLILFRYLTVMQLSDWSACRYYHTEKHYNPAEQGQTLQKITADCLLYALHLSHKGVWDTSVLLQLHTHFTRVKSLESQATIKLFKVQYLVKSTILKIWISIV